MWHVNFSAGQVDGRSGALLFGKWTKLDTALYTEAFLSVYIAQVVAPEDHN